MIAFDLECSAGHLFEGWFDSGEAFEEQLARDLVRCPYCDDTAVRRVLSPVAVKKSQAPEGVSREAIDYSRLAREIVNYVKENFEDVGPRFAAEALKMQYGVKERRNIRGSATADEEKILEKEGVPFFKFPLPKDTDPEKN